jgi:hypothetical protein
MSDPETKATVGDVGGWIWGVIEGGFNEQQSISQIVVDAAIGMIPVVGDITAVRDLLATVLRLVDHPEKRKDKLEWLTLAVLLFALIPVAGGAIKGIGKLVIVATEDVGEHPALLREIAILLARWGDGNEIQFAKKLDFESYIGPIKDQWAELTKRLDAVLSAVMRRAGSVIPDAMLRRLQQIQTGMRELASLGDQMIPDSLKELNRRLQAVQKSIYEGDWHEIRNSLTSTTREAEARLVKGGVDKAAALDSTKPFPPNVVEDFHPTPPWPNLKDERFVKRGVVASFSGPMQPIRIAPGTKIRRIVTKDAETFPAMKRGLFWSRELAPDGASWRKDCAVLQRWSDNGFYVELTVPESGLYAWEGRIASQVDSDVESATFGQHLPGGAMQLVIDFEDPIHAAAKSEVEQLRLIETRWTDHMNVNVPAPSVTLQELSPFELEAKSAGVAERALRAPTSDSDAQSSQTQQAPGP